MTATTPQILSSQPGLTLVEAFPILGLLRAPFAMVDLAGGESAGTYDGIEDVARAIHERRRGHGLQVVDARLVWGDDPAEDRPTIHVDFIARDGETVESRLTVLARGKTAADLRDALQATRPVKRAA